MSAAGAASLRSEVLERALAEGLDHVGVCSATPFEDVRDVLEQRRSEGLAATMQFTYRNPERSTDPGRALPGARSLVVAALGYAGPPPAAPEHPSGRVARYAGVDRYRHLRSALGAVAELLVARGHRARVLVDDNALVDRAAAVRAGIGWYGRSANVLVPGHGSWFVLGSVLTDADLGAPPDPDPVADGCGTCTRCLDGCPTGAIVAPGVVDARRCLAWLVQAEGDIPHEHRVAMSDRLYGCDECQEVCPPSRREESRVGVAAQPGPGDPGSWVDLLWVLEAGDADLLQRLGRWYVPRRDPRYLRRNALVALGNWAAEHGQHAARHDVAAALERHLDGGDDLLVGHAAWAALRADRADLLTAPERRDHPVVAAEVRRWPSRSGPGEDGAR